MQKGTILQNKFVLPALLGGMGAIAGLVLGWASKPTSGIAGQLNFGLYWRYLNNGNPLYQNSVSQINELLITYAFFGLVLGGAVGFIIIFCMNSMRRPPIDNKE
ncbi:hypothetical protein [Pacificispira sp.]|uniref:hypothetical protein n=1 Tax=Pacificispira sp. TaxID=2888761 RepID=UPI003B5217CA